MVVVRGPAQVEDDPGEEGGGPGVVVDGVVGDDVDDVTGEVVDGPGVVHVEAVAG